MPNLLGFILSCPCDSYMLGLSGVYTTLLCLQERRIQLLPTILLTNMKTQLPLVMFLAAFVAWSRSHGCNHDTALLRETAEKSRNRSIELLDDSGYNRFGRKLTHFEAHAELAKAGRHRGLLLHHQRRLLESDVERILLLPWQPIRLQWQPIAWDIEDISVDQQTVLVSVMDEAVRILQNALLVCDGMRRGCLHQWRIATHFGRCWLNFQAHAVCAGSTLNRTFTSVQNVHKYLLVKWPLCIVQRQRKRE